MESTEAEASGKIAANHDREIFLDYHNYGELVVFASNKKGNGVTFTVFLVVEQQVVQILTPADFSMIW